MTPTSSLASSLVATPEERQTEPRATPSCSSVMPDEPSSLIDQIAPSSSANAAVTQRTGRVLSCGPAGSCTVQVDSRELLADRATSCLVAPAPGDLVLLALSSDGVFVLAVLRRPNAAPTTLSVPEGDLRVQVPAGRFSMVARDGVTLATKADVQVVSQELGVSVERAKLMAAEIVTLGGKAVLEIAQTKIKGSLLEGVFERTLMKMKRSFRRVEEVDSLQAGDIDYKANSSLGLRSQNTVMTATELIKADAEQIHFG